MQNFKSAEKYMLLITGMCLIGCATGTVNNNSGHTMPVPEVPLNDPRVIPVSRVDHPGWEDVHEYIVNNIDMNPAIIFLGDSITEGWEAHEGIDFWNQLKERYGKIKNYGIGGDCTQHVLWRLQNGELPQGINPGYVLLMIGTNNSGSGMVDAIAAGIGKIVILINERAPSAQIILFSILPRQEEANTAVNTAVNTIIQKYDGYRNVRYYDLGKYYTSENGTFINELFTDGLHLSKAGYALWKDKITEILK
jgi:lysophospholipase L1-like esterase